MQKTCVSGELIAVGTCSFSVHPPLPHGLSLVPVDEYSATISGAAEVSYRFARAAALTVLHPARFSAHADICVLF